MSILIEQLQTYGADIKGAMSRFLDDEELYDSCFTAFLEDPCFAQLGQALEKKDDQEAFDAAHTLKGVAGNMGLTPMYEAISDLVESLRKEEHSHLQEQYTQIIAQYHVLEKIPH